MKRKIINTIDFLKVLGAWIFYFILTLLYFPLTIINICFVLYKYRNNDDKMIVLKNYFKSEIKEIDIYCGHQFRATFNAIMLKSTENQYLFGTNKRETISSIMGKNELNNNTSTFGKFTSKICNIFEKDHYIKSIDSHIKNK